MIETSERYNTLFDSGAIQDYKIVINGIEYTNEHIYDTIELDQDLFDKPTFTVGSFAISSLKTRLILNTKDVPHNASIEFYYRYNDGTETSEWIQKFSGNIVDRKQFNDSVIEITAMDKGYNYDVFLDNIEVDEYPANARDVAIKCATHLGVELVNPSDIINQNIVDYPNELTIVEVLKNIAKSSGGNFTMLGDGRLKIIILKNNIEVLEEYDVQSITDAIDINPITMVTAYWDDESAFQTGTTDGSDIIIDNPWATQLSTDYVYSVLNGFKYKPISGKGVYLDPKYELGDYFSYGSQDQLVAKISWNFGGTAIADVDAPISTDSNFDDPYQTLKEQAFKRKVTLGNSYQGVSISRENGIQMLYSPDGTEENALGRYYADLEKGIAFQTRTSPSENWFDWMYFDMDEKAFKLSLYDDSGEVDKKIGVFNQRISEIDVDISSIRLEVSRIGGYNIISNPIGRFGTLDWTFESLHIKAYANSPYNKAYANAPYLKAQANNGSIMTGVPTDTQAKYGFRVWKAGKALSKITEAESGSDYSLHTKVKGDAVLRFKLREYTSAVETNKSNFIKETLLGTTNQTVEYSTYEKTITLDTTTQAVCLVVESDVSSRNGQFALFTNTSFNIGQPKPYGESITDMNNRIDSAEARVTITEDTVDLFTSKVNTMEGKVNTNTAQLQVQAGEISSKVSTNGVISAINQTAESIKIHANKISLEGTVTANNNFKILPDGTIEAVNANISGTVTAMRGEIGNFELENGVLTYTSPVYEREYTWSDLSAIKTIIMKELTPTPYEFYIYDTTGDGIVTAVDYMQISNYLKGERVKPKRPMVQSQVKIGTIDGTIMSSVLFRNGQVGANTTIQADNVSTGTIETTGLSIRGQSVEVDSNGFLKLV